MANIDELLRGLEEFKKTPQNAGYDLRLDLADIILRHVDGIHLTQAQLARSAGMKPSFVNRLVHADSNATFDVAGRIFTALGIKAALIEVAGESVASTLPARGTAVHQNSIRTGTVYAQEIANKQAVLETREIRGAFRGCLQGGVGG
jgi:transcriptional regulator with XRE-family HTH domain